MDYKFEQYHKFQKNSDEVQGTPHFFSPEISDMAEGERRSVTKNKGRDLLSDLVAKSSQKDLSRVPVLGS